MFPSIESRLPFEGLICPAWEIFPVTGSASDDHHSLVLSIWLAARGIALSDARPSRLVTTVTALSQDQ